MDNIELVAKGFKTICEHYKNPYEEKLQKLEKELDRYKKAFSGDEQIVREILVELLEEHHNFEAHFNFYYLRIIATKIYHDNKPELYERLTNKPVHYIYKSGYESGFMCGMMLTIILMTLIMVIILLFIKNKIILQ